MHPTRLGAASVLTLGLLVLACSTGSTSSSSGGTSGSSGASTSSSGGTSSSGSTSTSSGSTTTEKYACGLNGACYKCPSSQALIDCTDSKKGPSVAGCTSTDASFCQ